MPSSLRPSINPASLEDRPPACNATIVTSQWFRTGVGRGGGTQGARPKRPVQNISRKLRTLLESRPRTFRSLPSVPVWGHVPVSLDERCSYLRSSAHRLGLNAIGRGSEAGEHARPAARRRRERDAALVDRLRLGADDLAPDDRDMASGFTDKAGLSSFVPTAASRLTDQGLRAAAPDDGVRGSVPGGSPVIFASQTRADRERTLRLLTCSLRARAAGLVPSGTLCIDSIAGMKNLQAIDPATAFVGTERLRPRPISARGSTGVAVRTARPILVDPNGFAEERSWKRPPLYSAKCTNR